MDTRTQKELKKEEQQIYYKLMQFVKEKKISESQEFCKLLSEYVDVQIELEKFCNV